MSKHGVENVAAMATCDTVDAKTFPESCSPINFSNSGHIWFVLLKCQGSSRKLKSARALSAPPPPPQAE